MFRSLFACFALLLLIACGGGGGATGSGGNGTPAAATLSALSLSPASPSLLVGASTQFQATGTYSDGSAKDLSASVTWNSASPAAATITAGGLATGLASGTTVISANLGAIAGTTTLTVSAAPAATLSGLSVSPATLTLPKSGTQQFKATGTYTDGSSKDLSASVTWVSGTPSVASVSAGGLVTGLAAGTSAISASLGGYGSTGTVTVTAATLSSVAVSPVQVTVSTGSTATLTAVGTFSDLTTAPVVATWSSSNTAIATINASTGLVTGGSAYGTSTITAQVGSLSATGAVINQAPIPTSLVITPATPSVLVGATLKLNASVTWSDGHVTDQSGPATWTTSAPAIATVVGGTVSGVGAGSATITATFSSQSSGSITNQVTASTTLTVNTSLLQSLAVSPATGSVGVGTGLALTATGTYGDGHTANLTGSVAWSSSNSAVATVSTTGTVSALAAGRTTISAKLGAITGTADLTVTALPATLSAITVSPATVTVARSATRQLTATGAYSDGSSKDLTGSVTWSSSQPGIASVTAGGLVTGVAGGSAVITASLSGLSGTSQVTVSLPTLTALAVTPTQAVVSNGGTYTFAAVGTYSDGSTAPTAVTWSSTNTAIATVNATTGVVTGGATYGSATITATLGALSAAGTIINNAPIPTSLVITPATPSVAVGASLKLTASVTWSDGHVTDQSGPAAWSTSSAAIASLVGAGTVTGVAAGSATITATFTSLSSGSITTIVTGHVTLNVAAAPLTSLAIAPATSTMTVGGTEGLVVTGTYADGHTADFTLASVWTSSNNAVATVAYTGVVTAQGAGSATITATLGAFTATAAITVNAATSLTSITLTPANQTLAVGATSQYTALGAFSDGTGHQLSTGVSWSVSPASVATVDATWGIVTAVGAGTATLSATSAGVTGHTGLTVSAPAPTFDSRLVGSWKWIGFPDLDGNSYGSFYTFYANGTFTYDLIYLGSGVNCIYYNKVIAHHEGTFTSLGSLNDLTHAGEIIFTCSAHYTDYTSCGGSGTRMGFIGGNPHYHSAAFANLNQLVTLNNSDWYPAGIITHNRQ